jgi:hypothetical protein
MTEWYDCIVSSLGNNEKPRQLSPETAVDHNNNGEHHSCIQAKVVRRNYRRQYASNIFSLVFRTVYTPTKRNRPFLHVRILMDTSVLVNGLDMRAFSHIIRTQILRNTFYNMRNSFVLIHHSARYNKWFNYRRIL